MNRICLLFLTGAVLLLLLAPGDQLSPRSALGFTATGDEFSGPGLDPTFWNTSTLTSGPRWCLPAAPDDWRDMSTVSCSGIQAGPYGTAALSGGELAVDGLGKRAFPYFWSNDGMLPNNGDFVIQIRFKRDSSAAAYNSGFFISHWDDPTPSGTNSPVGGKQCATLAVWTNGYTTILRTGDYQTGAGVNEVPIGSFDSYHVYTFEYVNGKYLAFVDGVMIIGPVSSIERANRVWVGTPAAFSSAATWDSFSADYIHVGVTDPEFPVQPALIDIDNNGQYDGTQVWTPTNLTTASQIDSDSDGYPNACDPVPGIAATGTVNISQQTEPDAHPQTFQFTGAVAGTIGDGGTISSTVNSGVRTVIQSPQPTGWKLASVTCDDPESAPNVAGAMVTLTIQDNETVNCTFTNSKCPGVAVPPADDDCDGVDTAAETACGSDPSDMTPPLSRPERIDGAFAGTDDDGDLAVDEVLPPGAANFDCDGDGYKGSPEAGTPLCGNAANDDTNVYLVFPGPQVMDDAVIDDGCPGGPPQAGAYSEAQFNIGLTDQDPCGTNGWPADLVSGGIPDSTNKVSVTDFTSFLAPVRHLDKSPGHPDFNSRWDLMPGRGLFSNWIAINDLTSLITLAPPMLGGVRAMSGPACPWAP